MTAGRAPLVLVAYVDTGSEAGEALGATRDAAQVLLRRLAGEALGCDPATILLAHDAAGRPVVAGTEGATALRCSVSHAGSVAAAVVALGCAAGVDVEPVDPRRADLATVGRYVHPTVAATLAAGPEDERPAAVALAWTRLEAEAKGRGIALDRLRGRPRTGVSVTLDVGPRHVGTAWTDRPAMIRHLPAPSPGAEPATAR